MNKVTPLLAAFLAAGAFATASDCVAAKKTKPLPVYKTSFDCASPRSTVENLICHDGQLAQMDLELNRLYLLALTDDHSVPKPAKVEIDQQFWIDARNQCGGGPQARGCVIGSYAERADQLRQGSAIARTKDPSRLSEGPVAFRCAGMSTPVSATYFTVQPGVVFLKWAKSSATLMQVPSDSGHLYTGKDYRGSYRFWQDGNDATLQVPASGQMVCTAEPVS